MRYDYDFFKTTMPRTRPADYYLGCHDGSVFIDLVKNPDGLIALARISFDGYGCCRVEDSKLLSKSESREFRKAMGQEPLVQEALTPLVLKLIDINQDAIWTDALERYDLLYDIDA